MSRWPVIAWLVGLVACLVIAAQARYAADLGAFLPSAPSASQRLLVEQLRDGPAARIVLAEIRGGDDAARARASQAFAERLRAPGSAFAFVANGAAGGFEREQALVFGHRYSLSPEVTAAAFEVPALREALRAMLDRLAGAPGLELAALSARDPTGESLRLVDRLLATGGQAALRDGVWSTADGTAALLVLQLRADGIALDAQQRALEAAHAALAAVAPGLRLALTGAPVFAVEARETIRREVTVLCGVALALVTGLLVAVLRAPRSIAFALLPMGSGVLAGVAAVALVHDTVHGLTLGFGATLIGEAVDYAIYGLLQPRGAASLRWTVRLGVATSVIGFSVLLLSGFEGLSQLGLFSIAGLVTAAWVAQQVLPRLGPPTVPAAEAVVERLERGLERGLVVNRWLRPVALGALALALVALALATRPGWSDALESLSPVPVEAREFDARLRGELGATDLRWLVVARGADREAVLRSAEAVQAGLAPLVADARLGGVDSPTLWVPSEAVQQARREALPPADVLRARLAEAARELPLRVERLEPFVAAVAAAREAPPVTPATWAGTAIGLALDAQLQVRADGWIAVLALRPPRAEPGGPIGPGGAPPDASPAAGSIDAAAVRNALAAVPQAALIDVKGEADALYAAYLREAWGLSTLGAGAILVLLGAVLRDARRWLVAVAPIAAAAVATVALLQLRGVPLTLFHLIGVLLVVAVGSNYALFLEQLGRDARRGEPRTRGVLASLLFANATTVAGFGVLAFASVPLLQAIGTTVATGTALTLIFAVALHRPVQPAASGARA